MKLWYLVSLALFLPWVGQTPAPQGLSKAQKDALLSRKTWYMSYEFTVSGNGSSESGAGETHTKLDWKVGRRTTGTIELNFAIPGQWLPSWTVDPLALTPGRFISWRPMPSEKVQELIAKGERNPANLPGVWFPYYPETLDRSESWGGGHHNISTYELNGVGYTDGTCSLHLDLQDNIYEVTFQSQASGLGDKAKHKWRNKYANEPEVVGSDELEIPEQYTAWFPDDAKPVLIKRKLLQDLKPDGSIVFSHAGTMELPQGKVGYGVTFRFSPTPPSVAKFYIEPADPPAYAKWRPVPNRTEEVPGNTIDVKFSVEEPGVTPDRQAKVRKVTLRLGNVSRYPGVSMNFPLAPSSSPKPDLRFKTMKDTATVYYTMGQENEYVAIIGSGDLSAPRTGTLTVECFDGAALGEVVGEVELFDGRVVTAEVRGQTASRKLLIPDREEGVSDLAKSWRTKRADGLSDNSDDENDPEGDGQPGDGLTVWEEYRGFHQGGIWRDNCYPDTKDLFIVNKVGAAAKAGIGLFGDSTGLEVHDLLQEKEYFADRRINFNVRQDRHIVDQHFLFLTRSPHAGYGICESLPGKDMGGPPKNTLRVDAVLGIPINVIYGIEANRQLIIQDPQATMIAHELCHAIGVYHHGESDVKKTLRLDRAGSEAQVLDGANVIKTVSEPAAAPISLVNNFSKNAQGQWLLQLWVGMPQGQHSGDDSCFMRYDVAQAYPLANNSLTFVCLGEREKTGEMLCTSPKGEGVNGSSHLPHSRYGSADSVNKRGDCTHQFVISDRWEAKQR